MKKKLILCNLVLALFIGGCSNAKVNEMMSSVSKTLKTGASNFSTFVKNLANKPENIQPEVPKSKYFEIYNYNINIRYRDDHGLEATIKGDVNNKTRNPITIKTDFLVFDLLGNVVDTYETSNTLYPDSFKYFISSYVNYNLYKDLRISKEFIRTRVYMGGKLIATAGKITDKAPTTKSTTTTKKTTTAPTKQTKQTKQTQTKQEGKQEAPTTNSASPKPRQARQTVKK